MLQLVQRCIYRSGIKNEFANGCKIGFFHSQGGKSTEPPLDKIYLLSFRQELFLFAIMIY